MNKEKKRQRRDWDMIIESWRSSGLTVKEFCREQMINRSDFYRHRREREEKTQGLVKIEPVSEEQSRLVIVETPNRYRVLIQEGVDAEHLGFVLSVVERQR